MLKNKYKILFLFVIIITILSTFCFATAEPREVDESNEVMPISETDVTNEIDESEGISSTDPDWVNADLYLFDDKVEINQIVDGNVFVIAQEVTISGEIAGDAFICANKINIEGGYIYSNLFAIANEINIDGIVYDVYAIAGTFNLTSNGYIYRDLQVSSNTFNLDGKIRRDAYLNCANYNFSEENGALVGGNLNYSSTSEISIPENIIAGNIVYTPETVIEESVASKVYSYIFDALNLLVFTFVIILLAMWLAPKFVSRVSNMNSKKAFASLGIGIITPIVVTFTLLMLILSSICSTIAFAAIMIFIAICMSGFAFASIYFGALFAKLLKLDGKVKFVLSTLVVTLILWVISQIPYIGGLFGFLVSLFGIGTLLFNIVYRKEEKTEESVTE